MSRIKKVISFALLLVGVGSLLSAPALAAELAGAPQIKAHISLDDKDFDQSVMLTFSPAQDLTAVRARVLDTNLLKQLTTWVADASFKTVGNDDQFWLTIGKMGKNFTHMFHCQETVSAADWLLACAEDEKVPDGQKVVLNTTKTVHCQNSSATDSSPSNTTCMFSMKGDAEDLNLHGLFSMHIPAREISYTLFSETVAYALGIGYLAGGLSANADSAKKLYKNSASFDDLLREIQVTGTLVKNAKVSNILSYDFSSSENTSAFASNGVDVSNYINTLTAGVVSAANM